MWIDGKRECLELGQRADVFERTGRLRGTRDAQLMIQSFRGHRIIKKKIVAIERDFRRPKIAANGEIGHAQSTTRKFPFDEIIRDQQWKSALFAADFGTAHGGIHAVRLPGNWPGADRVIIAVMFPDKWIGEVIRIYWIFVSPHFAPQPKSIVGKKMQEPARSSLKNCSGPLRA